LSGRLPKNIPLIIGLLNLAGRNALYRKAEAAAAAGKVLKSMTEIIGVRFKNTGKTYYFSPGGERLAIGEKVIVETARGVECGSVVIANREIEDSRIVAPLKSIIRRAGEKDLAQLEENARKEKEAFQVCLEKIAKHKLQMNLVDVEYTFDNNKVLFYFTADGRIDFRELVKDLAGVFRTRIELRQIGVRDEAKMLGGLGICGRPFCCASFLGDFQPVSIKMAKEQGLSLNPTKISGACGRLMCCLKYEQDAYESLLRITPRVGAAVQTPDGRGVVVDVNLLTGVLKVSLDGKDGAAPGEYHRRDVKPLRGEASRPSRHESEPQEFPEETED
jgi:cell fate regulator YaaT (PSP1 superfamily)